MELSAGFSFCGISIDDFGLEYAPELSNTYTHAAAPKNIHEQIIEANEGGYFYGATTGPKDFVLRCFFEEKDVRNGIITKIESFFYVGRTGKLVFNQRPWCWYAATVLAVDTNGLTNYMNGVVTIKMRAYYPYAKSDTTYLPATSDYRQDMINNSALIASGRMPTTQIIPTGSTLTSQTTVLLYNPGTQRAKVAVEIAGDVGDGVTIANTTTNQLCKFVAISSAVTTSAGKYVVSDAQNGKTILTNGTTSELAFLYHDSGFIELQPAFPIVRDVNVTYTQNSSQVTLSVTALPEYIGKHIYVGGAWRKIQSIASTNKVNVSPAPSGTGSNTAEIVQMNEIVITPVSTMTLKRLNFVYSPTYS